MDKRLQMQPKIHADFTVLWPYPQQLRERAAWLLENMMKLVVWKVRAAHVDAMMKNRVSDDRRVLVHSKEKSTYCVTSGWHTEVSLPQAAVAPCHMALFILGAVRAAPLFTRLQTIPPAVRHLTNLLNPFWLSLPDR